MSTALPRDVPLGIRPGFRLQWEEAQGTHVLLFPEGMVTLSPSATEILKRCDGSRTADQVVAELEASFPDADLEADVIEFLTVALDKGWIAPT